MTDADKAPALEPEVLDRLRALTPEGEADVLNDVLTLFVTEAATRLDVLAAAIQAGEAPTVQRAAHALKGAAGSIGARRLQDACRALEELGRASALESSAAAFAAVRAEHARVIAEIGRLTAR